MRHGAATEEGDHGMDEFVRQHAIELFGLLQRAT